MNTRKTTTKPKKQDVLQLVRAEVAEIREHITASKGRVGLTPETVVPYRFYRMAPVARMLGLTPYLLKKLITQGKIQALRADQDGQYLISGAAIQKFVDSVTGEE